MNKILKVIGMVIKLYLVADIILYTWIGIGVWLESWTSDKSLSTQADDIVERTKTNYKKFWNNLKEAQ